MAIHPDRRIPTANETGSPKSHRPHGPAEKPATDGLTTTNIGQHGANVQGGPEKGPMVPKGLKHHGGAHQGTMEANQVHTAGPRAPMQGGGPGFAKAGDEMRKGGTVHQT